MNIEFDARFACEAYPDEGESEVDVLKRGDFQHHAPTLLQWRSYEIDDEGEPCNFGEWHIAPAIDLMKFYE